MGAGRRALGLRAAGRRALACGAAVWMLGACASADPPQAARGPAVLRVLVGAGPGAEEAVGIAIGGDRVLTVAHVLEGQDTARVVLASGRATRACVVARAGASDAAVLRAPGLTAPTVRLATAAATERVVSLRDRRPWSRPPRGERSLTAKVRTPQNPVARRAVLRLGLAVRAGDSGSPALDASGRLTGMVFAARTGQDAVGYATAPGALRPVVARGLRAAAC